MKIPKIPWRKAFTWSSPSVERRPVRTITWEREAGDPMGNSALIACLNWITRTFPEAPLCVNDFSEDAAVMVKDHPMLTLLERPNQYYSGVTLWMATLLDWWMDGNAYWMKDRSDSGNVVNLWWVHSSMMKPVGSRDGTEFITHYEYRPQGMPIEIDPADVVHFRNGLDMDNPRLGRSQLKALWKELFTDDEAAEFTASLLRNHGVPGLVFIPPSGVTLTETQKREFEERIKEKVHGHRRGEPLVADGGASVQQFGFSPEQMNLGVIRQIPEERISAVLGVPAAVAGLGTGLEQTKVGATMRELRELAYENNIIPTQRLMAADLHTQLLPDWEDDTSMLSVGFDLSSVRVLQEDQNAIAQRWVTIVNGGIATVSTAQAALGIPVDESQNVYLRPFSVTEVQEGTRGAPMIDMSSLTVEDHEPLPVVVKGTWTNGNGNSPH